MIKIASFVILLHSHNGGLYSYPDIIPAMPRAQCLRVASVINEELRLQFPEGGAPKAVCVPRIEDYEAE